MDGVSAVTDPHVASRSGWRSLICVLPFMLAQLSSSSISSSSCTDDTENL